MKLKTFVITVIIIIVLSGLFVIYKAYTIFYKSNVHLNRIRSEYIYIPTGADYQKVRTLLIEAKYLSDIKTFDWLSEFKNYKNHIKPGKYRLNAGMNNNELLNMLKSGRQEPVNLVFNNVRTKYQLAGKIAKQLEADSLSIINILDDTEYVHKSGFTPENSIVVFIPNTYEIYWTTSAKQLFERMNKEFIKFWNNNRKEKAEKAGLSTVEVEILASIVQEETTQYNEMSVIAGLYINRLHRRMNLEADPTVKFAIGDFSIKRILKRHLEFDSPYNTYKNNGLPPGPICLPNPKVIDYVLDFEKHNYIHMCAKEDFSGYHNFAETSAEHTANARKYQNALNKLKIWQ